MSAPTASPRHRQRSYSTVLLLLFVLSLVCVGIAGQLHAAVPANGSPALVDDGQPQPLPAEGKGLAIEAAGEAGSAHEDNDSPRGLPPPRALLAPNHCNAGMRPCLAGFPVSDPRLRLNPGNGPPLA